MRGNASAIQGSILNDELEAHYESMEKLYSVVLSIQYALNRQNFDILSELSQAKVVLLEDIAQKKLDLDAWVQKVSQEETMPGFQISSGPIRKIKNLLQEIEAVEASTASQLQELRRTELQNEGLTRSDICKLTNQSSVLC